MTSHLPLLFSLLFRNKPEAVEVTFAGKLHNAPDLKNGGATSEGLPVVMSGALKFSQPSWVGGRGELHMDRLCEHHTLPKTDGLCSAGAKSPVGCPAVFSVHLPSLGLSPQQ